MRYMIIVRATPLSEAGIIPDDSPLMAAMASYHEDLAKAGVLLDAAGLQPSSKGWRIRWSATKPVLTDGPFAETKDLIAGWMIIDVDSWDRAVELAAELSAAPGAGGRPIHEWLEVRPFFEAPPTTFDWSA